MMIRYPTAGLLTLALATAAAYGAQPYVQRDEVHAFIAEMVEEHGFEKRKLQALFAKARPNRVVIKAIAPAADPGIRSWREYRSRFVEPARIGRGLAFWARHADALNRAEAEYGVPAEIIVAIIGVETIYGRHRGQFQAFNALTNLAFDYPPRAELFRRELEALLLLAREDRRDPWSYRSSYAGAIGLPQFLPSSIRSFAVDFDGDRRIDLTASADDAIGSVANFLSRHGWRAADPIACPARVTGDAAVLIAEGIQPVRLPAEMADFGVVAEDALAQPAALIDLVTPMAETEYRLGYNNFFVLTRYNRSSFYAAAVADLAQALRTARDRQ
jgi:membrane-bound lytic murein transglycosylase B